MKKARFFLIIGLASFMVVAGCGGGGNADGDSGDSGATAKAGGGSAASDVCAAVDALDESLDALTDSDSLDEYRERKETVRKDFERLRMASGGEYATECNAFEAALVEFEEDVDSLGDGGLISGMMGLAEGAAELAAAGDRLDDAIDCPGT